MFVFPSGSDSGGVPTGGRLLRGRTAESGPVLRPCRREPLPAVLDPDRSAVDESELFADESSLELRPRDDPEVRLLGVPPVPGVYVRSEFVVPVPVSPEEKRSVGSAVVEL